jgi:hypothetical protein
VSQEYFVLNQVHEELKQLADVYASHVQHEQQNRTAANGARQQAANAQAQMRFVTSKEEHERRACQHADMQHNAEYLDKIADGYARARDVAARRMNALPAHSLDEALATAMSVGIDEFLAAGWQCRPYLFEHGVFHLAGGSIADAHGQVRRQLSSRFGDDDKWNSARKPHFSESL